MNVRRNRFYELRTIIPPAIRAADRIAGAPLRWPDSDLPDDATTVPAKYLPAHELVGQLCRLSGNVSTTDGNIYPAGAIFKCDGSDEQGRLSISGYGLQMIQVPREVLEVILR